MRFEKLIYVIVSSLLVTILILISYVYNPFNSAESKENNVKRIFFADHISSAHQKLIANFNRKYKGQIFVEAINLPFEKFSTNERKELLARYLRSKSDRIDVFSVDQIWVPRFAKWAVRLENYIPSIQKKNILSYALESCIYNDTLVAVPLYIDVALMYYRKDLIKKLPDSNSYLAKIENSITWEDLIELGKNFKKEQNPFFIFQADDFEGLICSFVEMMASQGETIVRHDSLRLHTPEAKKALQMLIDLVNTFKISPVQVVQFKENPSYEYYLKNNGVFLRGWPSFLVDNKKTQYSYLLENIERAPTPHFKGKKPVSVFGGWNLMISKYSTNLQESILFINYLLSEEAQKILFEEGGYLPIVNSLYSNEMFAEKYKEIVFYKKLFARGVHRPFLETYTNIADILSYYLLLAIKNELSAGEALSHAEAKINSESILLK